MSKFLSVTDAARHLNLSVAQVRNLIRDGRLQAFKAGAGRAWIISEAALAQVERRLAGRPKSEKGSE